MQLVTTFLATMALSVCQLVLTTIMQRTWIAHFVISCVLVDVQGQGILLAKEDAMHVTLSTLIVMTHRCILSCVRLYVVQCMCAGGVQVKVCMARYCSVYQCHLYTCTYLVALLGFPSRYPVLHIAQPAPTDTSWSKP